MSMRVIIIEDTEIDTENLSILLEDREDCVLIGTADNIEDGMKLANSERPDLIFLDVQLGEVNSLEYINNLEYEPMIICTTLYNTHALEAFSIGAVGYIMKPVTRSNLDQAVERLLGLRSAQHDSADKSVLLKIGTTSRIVSFDDIILITGERDYTSVLDVSGKSTLSNRRMREWISLLPGGCFVQLDRSIIVNYSQVTSFSSLNSDNKSTVNFANGHELIIGATALSRLRRVIG